ncbi:isoprenoid synthase domain-containing protein [Podospora conica]|nr:isoprenoid synthase domain-containing protein [Schizothecium conicum]
MDITTPLEIDHTVVHTVVIVDDATAPDYPIPELKYLSHDAGTQTLVIDDSVTEASVSESEAEDPNEQLASQLRGRTLTIPAGMLSIFRDLGWPAVDMDRKKWSAEQEATYLRLKKDLEEIIGAPDAFTKAKACDFAYFTMLWNPPNIDYDVLITSSLLGTGLFVWDDFADSNAGSLGQDFDLACEFRAQTLKHIKASLGLDNSHVAEEVSGPTLVVCEFARRIKSMMSTDQLIRVFEALVLFVHEAEAEHRDRLAGHIPATAAEYVQMRYNTSACFACFYVLETFNNPAPPLPTWIMHSDEMRIIFDEGNYIISVHNDILSFKKELAQNCLINIVPVLYRAGTPWEQIMPTLDAELRAAADRLDGAARGLVAAVRAFGGPAGDAQAAAVERLVDGVRYACTGNLGYTLVTERYGGILERDGTGDGGVEMVM